MVPAYQQVKQGDYRLIKELQEVMNQPYDKQSKDMEERYYTKKPTALFEIGGVSHVNCLS